MKAKPRKGQGSFINGFTEKMLALLIGIVFAFILAEGIVRVSSDKFSYYLFPPVSTFKDALSDAELGYANFRNQRGSWSKECFSIYSVCTNSLGFRGGEWNMAADFKIGILGDSFMMAIEVPEDAHTSFILGKLLKKEILNTGVRRYGTVSEFLAYCKYLKALKANIVILFFHIETDVFDNSCELTKLIYATSKIYKPCACISGGKVEIKTNFDKPEASSVFEKPKSGVKNFLKNNCLSCLVIYRYIYNQYIYKLLFPSDKNFLDVYMPPKNKNWQEAWSITEKILVDLKNEVEQSGGKLLVVAIPGNINLLKGPRQIERAIGLKHLPEGFDVLYPVKKLEDISRKNSINFLALAPYFIEYKNRFHLKYPYFSYTCEGHWNPLGHFLVSNIVARYLLEHNWIPFLDAERESLLLKLNKNLSLSPEQVLGKEAYNQIYRGGTYLGRSNISKMFSEEEH